jgi:predicted MFS family arabinose efflux permease
MAMLRPQQANRWTLILLMILVAAGPHHATSISPFLNEIGDEFSVSDATVGQIGTVTFGAAFLVALAIAPFVSRYELRKILTLSLLLIGSMGLVTTIVPSYALLLPVRAIAGIGGGLAMAGGFAALGRAWPNADERKKRQGFVIGAMAGGPAFLTPFLRIIGERNSWESAVSAYSMFYIGVAVLVYLLLPPLRGSTDNDTGIGNAVRESLDVLTIPMIRITLILRFGSGVVLAAVVIFLAGFLDDEYSNGAAWIGPAFGTISAGFIPGSFLAARTMRALGGPVQTVVVGTLTMIATTVALAWVTPEPYVTTGILFFFGMFVGLYFNGMVAIIFEAAAERQSTAIFVDGALSPLNTTVGAAFGGIVIAASEGYDGWKWLITIASISLIVPMLTLWRISSRTHHSSVQ